MKSYHLDPAKLAEQKRNIILMYGITLIVMLAINFFLNRGRAVTTQTYLMIGLIIVMFVFVGWSAIRQRVILWEQFELTVDENGIKQKQPKSAGMLLPRAELTDMKESKHGMTLYIQSQPVLGVPKLLTAADYEEIKAIVQAWLTENRQIEAEDQKAEDEDDVLPAEEADQPTPPIEPKE